MRASNADYSGVKYTRKVNTKLASTQTLKKSGILVIRNQYLRRYKPLFRDAKTLKTSA